MKIKDLTTLITQRVGVPVNQSMIADVLGVTRQTISNRIKNNSELTVSELIKLEDSFNIELMKSHSDDLVQMYFYQDVFASCGNGNIVFSEDRISVAVSKIFIKNFSSKKQYSLISATGNSMYPFINAGDKLIIEHKNSDAQINDDKIYVFCYKNEFFVKRLSKNIDELIIKSDNEDYRTRVVKREELNNVSVIGEVVGIIRNV